MRTSEKVLADIEANNVRLAKANATILRSCAETISAECKKEKPDKITLKLVATALREEALNFDRDADEAAARRRDFLKADRERR